MRDYVRNDRIDIGGFSDPFSVIESMDGNAIVSAPVLYGHTA